MGKVLSAFSNGFTGAIARALDDVVVAFANKSDEALPFGVPVVLDTTKTGVIRFDPATHTGADFLGISVRNPSKTPDTYGASVGSYAPNDPVDVLVRGHIVIKLSGTATLGAQVGIRKDQGTFVPFSDADTQVALPNVRVSGVPDSSRMTEVVLTNRNLL